MHNKNNNKTQTFIQGLRPFSSSIPKTLKKHIKRGGYNYSNIVDNWTKIVSKKISDASYPITVKMGKEMRDGTLVLNVIHGKEMEIEYEKKEIIDRIEDFFKKTIYSIKIQSLWRRKLVLLNNNLRGPALINRCVCANEVDFNTLEPLSEIDNENFFSYTENVNNNELNDILL